MAGEVSGGGCADCADLMEKLAVEKAKRVVLLAQLAKSEESVATQDAEAFCDVIPEQDREYWLRQLVNNRADALGVLARLRNRMVTPKPVRPAPVVRRLMPLRNRETVCPSGPGELSPDAAAASAASAGLAAAEKAARLEAAEQAKRAARLRNRAHAIASRDGIPFTVAFGLAEREMGGML